MTDPSSAWLHDVVTALRRTDVEAGEVFLRVTAGITATRHPSGTIEVRSDVDAGVGVSTQVHRAGATVSGFASSSGVEGMTDAVACALRATGSRSRHPAASSPHPTALRLVDLPGPADLHDELTAAVAAAGPRPAEVSVRRELVATTVARIHGDVHTWTQRRHRIWCTVGRGSASPGWTGSPSEPSPLDAGVVAAEAGLQSDLLDTAVPCTAGATPVLWAPGTAGVLFHEVYGHAREADVWSRTRAASESDAPLSVAAPVVTGRDDPTLPGLWGSYPVDDQGSPSVRRTLVDRGRASDLVTSADSAWPGSGGHGRRQTYASPAVPRLANPHIAAGRDDPATLLASVSDGLYVLDARDGSFDPRTDRFWVDVRAARRIRAGELAEAIGPFRVSGSSSGGLRAVSGIGDDLAFVAGTCRKLGQEVPVANGSPTVLLDRMEVEPR